MYVAQGILCTRSLTTPLPDDSWFALGSGSSAGAGSGLTITRYIQRWDFGDEPEENVFLDFLLALLPCFFRFFLNVKRMFRMMFAVQYRK